MESLTTAQQELYDWLVQYIEEARHAPSIRQMMNAMKLRSPAPVQSRLERLRNKGYIDWTDGQARTLRILHQPDKGLPILGAIAAGGLVEPFTDEESKLDLTDLFSSTKDRYVLQVTGDSMIEDSIIEGDFVVMRSVSSLEEVKNGDIVAARVASKGTTLKRFYQQGDIITLQPANHQYQPIQADISQVEVQGILIGIWRNMANKN